MPIDTPLPAAFEAEMLPLLGEADTEALLHALNHTEPATSVRLNLHKMPQHLPATTDGGVPWCETGRYLAERPHFTGTPWRPREHRNTCSTCVPLPAARARCGAV